MSDLFIVTGGAGFIGRNIVSALNTRGENNIIIVDRLGTDEKWKNLRDLKYADFIDKSDFRTAVNQGGFEKATTLFHMGACSSTTETDADYLLDNNYAYTRDCCRWCDKTGTRFIYASSAATYGDGSLGYSDSDELTPKLRPLNMYGYSKHMFDLWALRNNLFKTIAGLKYFNVYGPYEDHKGDMRSVVNKAHGQIVKNGEVGLFKSYKPDCKDGEQVRDFIYVKDAVAQTLFLHDHRDVSGLFNCGTGRARTWVDLATATFTAMNREINISFIDMPKELRKKYQYHTEADMTKIRSAGFNSELTSLEDGVKDYVQSYLDRLTAIP